MASVNILQPCGDEAPGRHSRNSLPREVEKALVHVVQVGENSRDLPAICANETMPSSFPEALALFSDVTGVAQSGPVAPDLQPRAQLTTTLKRLRPPQEPEPEGRAGRLSASPSLKARGWEIVQNAPPSRLQS